MSRSVKWMVFIFLLYSAGMGVYLFGLERPIPVPESWVGTSADPATFMKASELEANVLYARIRDWLYFLETPFEWMVLLIGLSTGWFAESKKWLDRRIQSRFLSAIAFIVSVLGLTAVASLPFSAAYYGLSRATGVSNMSVGFWLFDWIKSFCVSTALILPVILLLFLLIRNSRRRWWLWMGILAVPLLIFYMLVQPVVLDPLFNDYELLDRPELEEDILALSKQAGVPAEHVYEVNMSERTNALNAYVTGVGSSARIVLWDTMLAQMPEDEILFTMAHEIGHYVMKHVYWGTGLTLVSLFITLYIMFRVSEWLIRRFGHDWQIPSISRLIALPLLVLIFSVVNFVSEPVNVAVSRHMERAADAYAIHLTQDPEAGITGFQQLARTGRAETYPPAFIKFWRYTHPPISSRLHSFVEAKTRQDDSR